MEWTSDNADGSTQEREVNLHISVASVPRAISWFIHVTAVQVAKDTPINTVMLDDFEHETQHQF
jgi:hypothetical protein